jgi:PAS domain-containing protein
VNGQSSGDQGGYGALDILDASQDCAWILRLDGAIEQVNQRAQAMFPARIHRHRQLAADLARGEPLFPGPRLYAPP